MQLGDKKLIVQRASVGARNPLIEQAMSGMGVSSLTSPLPINIPGLNMPSIGTEATEVLCLMNMVTPEELEDDEEYESKCPQFLPNAATQLIMIQNGLGSCLPYKAERRQYTVPSRTKIYLMW